MIEDEHDQAMEDLGVPTSMGNVSVALDRDQMIRFFALNMAIKYHDSTVISDGVLYQQYRMEGKEMQPLTQDHVIATALRYEIFIRCGENTERMAIIEAVSDQLDKSVADWEPEE